ncbi:MAG: glycoside hydrolase family 5 protein [Paludibacteraceae bacterium]|nr:glycoside hydrolase family 5 protein [Paludibacteraceae bacterium]
MKNYISLFSRMAMLVSVLILAACEPKNQPTEPDGTLKENINIVKMTIEQDAVVDPLLDQIVINYATTIKLANPSAITLNGSAVQASANGLDLTIKLSLESEKQYQLVIPSGAIRSFTDSTRTTPKLELRFSTKKAGDIGLPDNGAMAMTHALGYGWNLGNHFDTSSGVDGKPVQWGWWDGAVPTEQLYQNLARHGVKTVRMPVTWGNYQTQGEDNSWTIQPEYMAEVKQNVDWAIGAGLYVVLNTHHDEYWQDIISAAANNLTNDQIEDRIVKTWQQIAEEFKDHSDLLIFETFNEIHDNAWGWQGGYNYNKVYHLMDEWNQIAVDAIRATGSNNATRWIGVPGFCANPMFTCGDKYSIVLPNDPANKIMVAVHTYDPFNFCTEGTVQKWGKGVKPNGSDEKQIDDLMEKLRRAYIDNDIPVYLGEFGAVTRKSVADAPFQAYFLEYLCRSAYYHGIPVMLWDNNNNNQSGECFYYINHLNGELRDPYANGDTSLIPMMVRAATSTDPTYTLESVIARAPK